MGADLHASDPVLSQPGKRPGRHVEELIAFARERLGAGPWKLAGSRGKLGKTLFEVEDEYGGRIIGKVSRSSRARRTFEAMKTLWEAGMRPPSRFVVVEPLAWFPEKDLLLQRKAEGAPVLEQIRTRGSRAPAAVEAAAGWLSTLQRLEAPAAAAPTLDYARYLGELCSALPEHRARIERAGRELVDILLHPPGALVPSHGDYHPMNVYVAPERVTAIDLDTFACREPAADAGYFAAQTAIMGFHALGDLEATAGLRRRFLAAFPHIDPLRIAAHARFAFLRSLHYDLCILKRSRIAEVEPFLAAAAGGLDS